MEGEVSRYEGDILWAPEGFSTEATRCSRGAVTVCTHERGRGKFCREGLVGEETGAAGGDALLRTLHKQLLRSRHTQKPTKHIIV